MRREDSSGNEFLCTVFAGKLMEQRKHTEAALVLEQYAQVSPPRETEGAVVVVRTCADWAEDSFQGYFSLSITGPRAQTKAARLMRKVASLSLLLLVLSF